MNKYKLRGASLAQYAIILALTTVAVAIAYTLLGQNIVDCLKSFSGFMDENNKKIADTANAGKDAGPLKAGQLGGTSSKPVTKCTSGNCSIDYGDFILNGVPENFSEHVEAHGTSGGTDTIAGLMTQLAEELEKKGDTAGAQEYKDLANLAYFIASSQKNFEDQIATCSNPTDKDEILLKMFGAGTFPLPDNIKTLVPGYDKNMSNDYFMSIASNISFVRNFKVTAPGVTMDPGNIARIFVDKYDSIIAKDKYSPAMKDVTTQLYKQIGEVGYTAMSTMTQAQIVGMKPYPNPYYDPVTGIEDKENEIKLVGGPTSVNNFLHPQLNSKINLSAKLLCINGHNTDTGVACN